MSQPRSALCRPASSLLAAALNVIAIAGAAVAGPGQGPGAVDGSGIGMAVAGGGSGRLEPLQVVPAVSSVASGRIELTLDESGTTLRYALEYADLEGRASQARLYFGQRGVNGGAFAWLCGTSSEPGPVGTPVCPVDGGRVEGVLTEAQIVGPSAQGVRPGSFATLVEALRDGVVYAEVGSSKFASGELRAQLRLASLRSGLAPD